MTTDTSREDWLRSARELIDFLEQHPELDLPEDPELTAYSWEADAKKVRTTARALGTFKKSFTDYSVMLTRSFGRCKLRYYFSRSDICEKVQVGTKKEKQQRAVSYVEEEVEVPVYDYKCPSLMDLDLEDQPESTGEA